MPELRKDPLLDRLVLIAELRRDRPNDFAGLQKHPQVAADQAAGPSASCPFCPGNEEETPPTSYEQLDQDGQWLVRTVPNTFPAVSDDPATTAFGMHEVIVETRRHILQTSLLSVDDFARVIQAYRDRLAHWRADGRFSYGLIFKNVGPRAGASLAHLHSQLMTLSTVPSAIDREVQQLNLYHSQRAACPFCDRIADEQQDGQRVVMKQDGFLAFCPWASLHALETWILPTKHEPSFEVGSLSADPRPLASLLHEVWSRIERSVPSAGMNMVLRTAPWRGESSRLYHWRIELYPRTVTLAGLELATGVHINPVSPEDAAVTLRTARDHEGCTMLGAADEVDLSTDR